MSEFDPQVQVQMIWPHRLRHTPPPLRLPAGYRLRTYRPGDEGPFFEVMALAGWPGWDDKKLAPWLSRLLPEGWFMAVDEASGRIVATAMALHDPTWLVPFCGELGWVAADPAHTGRGLGFSVSAAVTGRFLETGYPHIHLFTETFRLPAIKSYFKLGYVPFLDRLPAEERWRELCDRLEWPFTPGEWPIPAQLPLQTG